MHILGSVCVCDSSVLLQFAYMKENIRNNSFSSNCLSLKYSGFPYDYLISQKPFLTCSKLVLSAHFIPCHMNIMIFMVFNKISYKRMGMIIAICKVFIAAHEFKILAVIWVTYF